MQPKLTDAVKSSVNAYLLARARAELMREKIDEIQRAILKESPLKNDLEVRHGMKQELITDPKLVYLSEDEEACQDYFAECNKRERAAGLKPDDMKDEFCPDIFKSAIPEVRYLTKLGADTWSIAI